MARYTLSALLAVASSTYVAAQSVQFPATPLANKHFAYPSGVPYQADTDTFGRGPQFGYNQCNSTTEGSNSLCQTAFMNHIDDFCLWAPSKPNSTIADTEGEELAWCTKKGRGTRIIPAGALKGVQLIKTQQYWQFAGFIDQTLLNLQSDDFGGELDPHGQDLRGNPIGGLVYSNSLQSSNSTFDQITEWNSFIGGGGFCFTICPDSGTNPGGYCRNTLDRLGCAVNSPNNAQSGTFEVCDGALKDLPGVYTTNGQTITYSQPDESLGPITTLPFTVTTPSSSNCITYQSSEIYTDLPQPTGSASLTSSGASPTGSNGAKSSGSAASRSASSSRAAVCASVEQGRTDAMV
ncbi:hypothetical protein EWM64_g4567 [Hericium alpestre]|uniref:Macrofage activating glycoprotein n=1 Tax=Hericium alpestre TaxID=135208 RepID=A0A4Y9ZZP1_9AGAM|nr:hypothetical protein EWM64_g4567 [Hericium alpestre]